MNVVDVLKLKFDELGSVEKVSQWLGCSRGSVDKWLKGSMPSMAWQLVIVNKYKGENNESKKPKNEN